MPKRKRIGAKELLDSKASHSGWVKKYSEKKFSKGYADRYCVLHRGCLYYFNDHNSRSQSEDLSLSCYRVLAKEDKKYKWGVTLENIGFRKSCKYHFAVSSQREQEEWIKHIKDEIELNNNCDEVDSEEEYDDVKTELPLEYDYAKTKPDNVTIFDPEPPMKTFQNKSPFAKADSFLIGNQFHGPMFSNSKSPTPKVPPRPEHTLSQDNEAIPQDYIFQYDRPTRDNSGSKDYVQMSSYVENGGKTEDGTCSEDTYLHLNDSDSDDDKEYVNMLTRDEGDDKTYDYLSTDTTHDHLLPNSVYQWQLTRDEADLSLKKFNKKGVYLIRENKDKRHVLSVFDGHHSRHYIIYNKTELVFLSRDPEPKFDSLVDLVKHYREHNLPTCNTKLEVPYR